eukprot:GSMAST32.ASY1.ANO1.1942.1 assembled CDS
MAINNNRPPALPPLSTLFQGAPATPVTQGMLGVGERDSFSSTYELGRIIGRGSASLVRQARHRVTGQICAVKHINMSSIHYKDRQQLRVEVTILKNARHRNIVSLLDLYETRDELILVMEYALGGELFDRIVAKGKYSEHEASIVMTKLLKAVEYLHNRNIVHRDIKPENILLASPESDTDIKVSDFGIAKILKGHVSTINAPTVRPTRAFSTCGTDCYMYPSKTNRNEGYHAPVDMWIMYILLSGEPPFENDFYVRFKIECNWFAGQRNRSDFSVRFNDVYWGTISAEAKDLICCLLTKNPERRITASQALKHPWLKGETHSLGTGDTLPESHSLQLRRYISQRKESMSGCFGMDVDT